MDIMNYLIPRLLAARPGRWPLIAEATGVSFSSIRKIAYRDTPDPGVLLVQKLIDYFADIDACRRELPPLPTGERPRREYKPRTKTTQPAPAAAANRERAEVS